MKDSKGILIIIVIIVLGILAYGLLRKDPVVSTPNQTDNNNDTAQVESVAGCYVATAGKDLYTLNIQMQTEENVSGKLAFKNFEKDSSSGIFTGKYENGILLGDYTFQSEGLQSQMQVIFKKEGDNFVRGYGPVDSETGTKFTDLSQITFDSSSTLSLFEKGECVE
jgi:hypothetical protein